jgi:hypothetical protein
VRIESHNRRQAAAVLAALLAGCQPEVVVSPPAQQRIPYRPEPVGRFVYMNQPDAEKYFISGIYGLESNAWRWAGPTAVLRFHLTETESLAYVMKFAVPRELTAQIVPVHLRILINGQRWQDLSYDQQGIYDLEKPAPAAILKPQSDNLVTIAIERPPVSDSRAPEPKFILVQVGFQPLAKKS